MSDTKTDIPLKPRSLLTIMGFLRKYPMRVTFCLALLFVAIGTEMTLPQIIGNAINGLRTALKEGAAFSPWPYVSVFLALAVMRSVVGYFAGTLRNRIIQPTLGDIRAAIYNALQRLAFTYHDKANSGELISRATTDVWRLQDFLYSCLLLWLDILISLAVIPGFCFLKGLFVSLISGVT